MTDQVADGLSAMRSMMQSDNELFLLAISGAVSALTLEAVNRFTKIMSQWANSATGFDWLRNMLTFRIFGGKLEVSKLIGVVIYMVVSLFFLALIVFGILGPLVLGDPDDKPKTTKGKNKDE